METTEKLTSGTGFWVLLACILASSMAFIDQSALNIALPTIQEDLDAGGAELLWVVNAYLIFLSALILVGGSLGDHFGRKRIFMLGIGIFTVASALCGLAPSVEFLIGARALQGLGGALMVPGSLAIISAYFGERRGEAIGTWSAFSTVTTILGPIIGGILVDQGLWRMIFFINLPLAAISLYALVRYVPESHDEAATARLDYEGAILATIGLAGLTYGFIEIAERGLGNLVVLGAFSAGVWGLGLFLWVEMTSPHPMMPLHLFKSRTFSGTNAMTLFLYAALAGALFFLPLNLIQVQGYGESEVGTVLLPFALLLTVMSRNMGKLADRIGARLPLTVGPIIVGVGFLVASLPGITDGFSDYPTTYFPAIVLMGIGMGIVVAPLTAAVMGAVASQQAGVASGVNNAVARSANVFAIAIMGAIALTAFSNNLDERTQNLSMNEEQRAFLAEEAKNLGDAALPEGLSSDSQASTQEAIDEAFVEMFRLTNYIAAGLAFVSAGLAFVVIEPHS